MADIPVPSLPDVTPAPTDRQMVVQADDELGLTPAVSAAAVDGKVSKSGDTMTGNLELEGAAPKFTLNETDQAADAGAWKLQASAGTLKISSASDAGSQQIAFININRASGELDMTEASSLSVPDATADGEALAYGQAGAELAGLRSTAGVVVNSSVTTAAVSVDGTSSPNRGARFRWARDGVTRLLFRQADSDENVFLLDHSPSSGGTKTPLRVNSDGTLNLTGASSVSVPAAADGDTNTAAQTTGFDSTTGQVQVNGVEVGDTGPRADSTALLNGWTGADTILQRVGNMVTVALVSLNGTSNTGTAVYTLPDGFRPANTNFARIALVDSAAGLYRSYETANALNITTVSTSVGGNPTTDITAMRATWTFPTADAWPATLPGTPA